MQDALDYSSLIDSAMRGVVRDVLKQAMEKGLPGEHYFYVAFRTDAPGVKVSDTLRARYPQEMTIVLQHQFWDFRVEAQGFQVTLSFGGVPEKLLIPFSAITSFADPSVKFGLQFHAVPQPDIVALGEEGEASPTEERQGQEAPGAAEIISLDAFRKK